METNETFAAQVAARENAEKHAEEIRQSRVGGLGGSDAALVLKVGERGLAALTNTDHKRLCVMLGMQEQSDFGGNAYTNAGHMFEDWVAKTKPWGNVEYEREKVIEERLSLQFRTFAHADFYHDGVVAECKYVQKTTDKVASEYSAQLQWYYMLGVREVYLLHGQGSVEPFEVEECVLLKIERDEEIIAKLIAGVKTLSIAIADGWQPNFSEKFALEDVPMSVQESIRTLAQLKVEEVRIKEQRDAASKIVKDYCEEWHATSIVGMIGEQNVRAVYTRESETKTFDAKKFKAEHQDIDLAKYYKVAKRSATVSISL